VADPNRETSIAALTIAAGASDSGAFDASGGAVKAVLTVSGTQGANLALLRGPTVDGPWGLARDTEGSVIAVPFVAGDAIELDAALFDGVTWFRFRTLQADGATPQTQSAARTLHAWVLA
jgi:hypothetical protein